MKIAILDDYQDQVRHLPCFALLAGHDVTILNQSEPDTARLAAMLEEVEALVLIRERTRIDEQLLMRLPTLKLISQTGKISQHIDPVLCQRYGVAVAEGVGSPVAPAELCWALIMAASRHIPAYTRELTNGQWQHSANPTRQAALDVFDSEPADLDNEPLLALPNVLATPHLGYVEQNSYELYFRKAFENVLAFAEGRPQHLVMPALG